MLLEDILKKAADGICVCHNISAEPYVKFTHWNPRMTEITGYTLDEINKLGWYQSVYPDPELQQKAVERMSSMRKGDDIKAEEWNILTKDNIKKTLSISTSVLKEENGEVHVLAVMQDITERKQNEEAMNKLQAQFAHALEIARLAPWEYDVSTDTFTFNDYFYKIFSASAAEVGGYELSPEEYANRFLYPDDIPLVREETQKAIETTDPNFTRKIEHRIIYSDGTIGHMSVKIFIEKDHTGKTVKTYGVNQDITDSKKMEEKLVEATAKYSTIFNQSVEGFYVHDLEGQIIDVNEMACQQTGYSREELLKLNVLEFHVDTAETQKMTKDEALLSWRERQPGEKLLILAAHKRKDGTVFPVQITSGAAYFGRTKLILAVVQDITERKQAEEEKNKLAIRLQQAQKMESIGTLAGGIAHDFNNILLPIILHAEMAIDDLSPDNPLQQDMIEILKAAKRAKELVQQILTIARKKLEEKVILKSSIVVKEAVKFLRSTIPTTIDIRYDVKTDQDTVLADPTQLNQIVMNLCTNAAHAMKDKGGSIKIILCNETLSNEKLSRFPDLKPGKYVKLSVEDTGTGIAPEIINKIFEPYYSTKNVGEGTGLGLSIIHGIVKNCNGDIDFISIPDEGATFHVYLPLVETEVTPLIERSPEVPKGNERILFVDDEKPVVDVNRKILERLGYSVTTETDSIAALEIFRKDPGAFDLVISDMTMPKMTGIELFNELKRSRPDMPVIICTGFSDKIDDKTAPKMGIDGFVNKPITGSEIAQIIRNVLDSVHPKTIVFE
ncbi:MAG: PAS domain S-box protein [Desulfobacteraceae bacterium]|jgi:PAS domain S-box-containing protein